MTTEALGTVTGARTLPLACASFRAESHVKGPPVVSCL